MAPVHRQGAKHSGEVQRDMIGGVDGAGGRRQCQEGVVNVMGCEAALGVHTVFDKSDQVFSTFS
jgi:hypothetical protein